MVEINPDPDAGGNRIQPDDGRDERGRLPEPLDAAHWPPTDEGPAILLPGMAPGQPAGTGPVVSTPLPDDETGATDVDDSAAAQGVGDPAGNPPPGMRHEQPPAAPKPGPPAEPTGAAKSTTTKKTS